MMVYALYVVWMVVVVAFVFIFGPRSWSVRLFSLGLALFSMAVVTWVEASKQGWAWPL